MKKKKNNVDTIISNALKEAAKDIWKNEHKARNRDRALKAGAYDGRFSPKVVKDKKKDLEKRGSKKNIWKKFDL